MPETGPIPTPKKAATQPVPIQVTQDQIDEQAKTQSGVQAREQLVWDVVQTLLPVLSPSVTLNNLRYVVGLTIDVAQSSPNGRASQGLEQ